MTRRCAPAPSRLRPAALLLLLMVIPGCSDQSVTDIVSQWLHGSKRGMERQPFVPSTQEGPRPPSPAGSVPRQSRVHSVGEADEKASVNRGARVYAVNCAQCHGAEGHGDGPVGPYLTHPPPSLRTPSVQMKPVEALYDVVTNGVEVMPAFGKHLTLAERRAVAQFVRSLGSAELMEAAPEGQPGRALYRAYCQMCHGAEGRGDGPTASALTPRPANLREGLKRGDTVHAVVQTMTNGVPGTAMPSFAQLPEQDRTAIAEYVVALRQQR